MNKILELFKIAEIHRNRIVEALENITPLLPFTPQTIETISSSNFLWIELLTSRFGKLQDYIGSKLMDLVLDYMQEQSKGLSMLDKLNKLEQLGVIESADLWKIIRNTRNHVTHEYPDNLNLTSEYLNQLVELTPKLLDILDSLQNKVVKKTNE
jgi:hypothetical protein